MQQQMPTLREDIARPVAACGCGWVSHSPKYMLKYHADVHGCEQAKRVIRLMEGEQ